VLTALHLRQPPSSALGGGPILQLIENREVFSFAPFLNSAFVFNNILALVSNENP
jgi:hypothetical protein